jgi:hypothetical protein
MDQNSKGETGQNDTSTKPAFKGEKYRNEQWTYETTVLLCAVFEGEPEANGRRRFGIEESRIVMDRHCSKHKRRV